MQHSIDQLCDTGNIQKRAVEQKSASAKKLVQARLPFKRADSTSLPKESKVRMLKDCAPDEIGKHEVCYISDEDKKLNVSTNLDATVKIRNYEGELEHCMNDVILLDDSTEEECSKHPFNVKQTVDKGSRPKLHLKFPFHTEKIRRKRKSKGVAVISPENDLQQQKKSKLDIESTNIDKTAREIIDSKSQGVIEKAKICNDVIDVVDEDLAKQFCPNLMTHNKLNDSVRKFAEDTVEDNGNLSLTMRQSNEEFKDNSMLETNSSIGSAFDREGECKKNVLIPKQVKLFAKRRKAREEKERKLKEQRHQKQLLKQEKELLKKRQREERNNMKKKEREEKEQKRLAELEVKNQERRARNEIKEEEWRKKENERKRKEQEKEEIELKKKKEAEAFTKFFVPKPHLHNSKQLSKLTDCTDKFIEKNLAFQPFQIKGDMKLAPIHRRNFTSEARSHLDNVLYNKILCNGKNDETDSRNLLYLAQLKDGKFLPVKWRRTFEDSSDDDIIIVDDLDRMGRAILEETTCNKREVIRTKFYKFHDNRRPPYYGTWRKKSTVITSRKPFAQDTKYFDYGVDSDDEWEEEEPGESLNGSEEDKDSQDDEYEVDNEWFVPHGHLSEEELHSRDDISGFDEANNERETLKIKLQLLQQEFTQEMKRKTEKIKPRLIGCIWTDENGNPPENCAKILWDNLQTRAMLCSEPLIIEESEQAKLHCHSSNMINGIAEKINEKLKPITLSNELVKKLASLMHGNKHSRNFLINEFIAYIEKTEDAIKRGDVRGPLKSVVRDKINEIAQWKVIDRVHDASTASGASRENFKKKEKQKKELCWVVYDHILNKMGLENLNLRNTWGYTLTPRVNTFKKVVRTVTNAVETDSKGERQQMQGIDIETWKIKESNQLDTSYKKHVHTGGSTSTTYGERAAHVAPKTKLISEFLNKSLASKEAN